MDVENLEHHFNAQQIFMNCLVVSLAESAPAVVWRALSELRNALDSDAHIPDVQRESMERICQKFTELMTDQSAGK